MLLYKNHRFHYEGVSFAIPDGYYLDTNYGDGASDALDFWTKDKTLRIRIAIEHETKGPLAELNSIIRDFPSAFVVKENIEYPVVDSDNAVVVDTVKVLRPIAN